VAKDVVSGLVYEGRDSAHLYMPTSPGELHAVALLGRARAGVRIDAGTIERNMKSELTDAQTLEAVSLDDMLTIQMFPLRMASWVGSVLAAVALVLSLSGLYGVLTYVLGQRRQEIGIRMALGASAAAVVQLVMRQSARLAMVGGMAGLIVSFAALKILAAFVRLQNVALVDPVAFAVASVLAALAVAAASYAPARRATQVDPARVLRTEA
jgi:ABC-type antimicrobial peptide transport system permease subunit